MLLGLVVRLRSSGAQIYFSMFIFFDCTVPSVEWTWVEENFLSHCVLIPYSSLIRGLSHHWYSARDCFPLNRYFAMLLVFIPPERFFLVFWFLGIPNCYYESWLACFEFSSGAYGRKFLTTGITNGYYDIHNKSVCSYSAIIKLQITRKHDYVRT